MYCTKCGQPIDDKAVMCVHCGYQFVQPQQKPDDKPSTALAVLGFFIPIVGLILFLIYHDDKPKTAKSAGKGALAGFITGFVFSIILVILFTVIGFSVINDNLGPVYSGGGSVSMNMFMDENEWSEHVDISIGALEVVENEFFMETTLDVTVTNLNEERCSFYITIEAIDDNGYRLATDKIYVDSLNSGQSIVEEAFEYIDAESIEEYQNATFRVLEVSQTIVH